MLQELTSAESERWLKNRNMCADPFQLVPAGPSGTIPKSLEQETVVATVWEGRGRCHFRVGASLHVVMEY